MGKRQQERRKQLRAQQHSSPDFSENLRKTQIHDTLPQDPQLSLAAQLSARFDNAADNAARYSNELGLIEALDVLTLDVLSARLDQASDEER